MKNSGDLNELDENLDGPEIKLLGRELVIEYRMRK
jgi:hypothetical protein